MTVLLLNIQNGQLTMEGYSQLLTKKIEEEKKYAEIFTARGQKELALGCLSRATTMEKELAGEV